MSKPLGQHPGLKSGAGPITRFDASDQLCRIACEVKAGDGTGLTFDANKRVDYKVQRQVDPFIVYGIDAAGQAHRRRRPDRHDRGRTLPRRLLHRQRHRRPAGHRQRIDRAARKGPAPRVARTSCMAG
jgi:hypothetical protein